MVDEGGNNQLGWQTLHSKAMSSANCRLIHYTAKRNRKLFRAPIIDEVYNSIYTQAEFTCLPRQYPHSPLRLI